MMKALTPSQKAHHTARWARIMTKWLVTYSRGTGARWTIVDFGGKHAEARGVVDLIAVRKEHRKAGRGLKHGDLFEIVLIQTKGGSAPRPTDDDVARLRLVRRHHRAKAIVLASWRLGKTPELCRLVGAQWKEISAAEVFG